MIGVHFFSLERMLINQVRRGWVGFSIAAFGKKNRKNLPGLGLTLSVGADSFL
jgi:hypothetical protein